MISVEQKPPQNFKKALMWVQETATKINYEIIIIKLVYLRKN